MTALRKLLVVDDDPVVGASFNRVLSGKGYIVVSAENGADALAKLQAEKFDAVFTDLRMPGMDGLQVAEKVRAAQPWTPVVIVTGYGSPASEARARAAGVTGFLNKPLSPEMIEESAEMAVRTVAEGVSAPQAEAEAASLAATTIAEAAAKAAEPLVTEAPRRTVLGTVKNMLLFLAAPFIGLAYAVLLPFVGFGMLLYAALSNKEKKEPAAEAGTMAEAPVVEAPAPVVAPVAEAAAAERPAEPAALTAAKLLLGLIAAPFIGLAYIVVMPFAGLAALAWLGVKAAIVRSE